MTNHVPSRLLGDAVIDDPSEVERINRLEASADRELARRQKRKKRRPTGGRVVHMWINSQEQAELTELAERENISLSMAAKRVLKQALNRFANDK
jgi:hypothetical protein